jgi:hypothetical protein
LRRVLSEPVPDEVLPDEDSETTPDREANIELRAAIAEIGISQRRLAAMLGYSGRGFRHLTLDRPVPRPVAIIIGLLQLRKISVKTIERLLVDKRHDGADHGARASAQPQEIV